MAISTVGNSKIFYSFNNCSSSFKTHVPICSIKFSLIPNSYHYSIKSARSINGKRASEHLFRVPTIFCVVEDTNETRPESIKSSASSDSTKEPAFNLNLPRRSLLATFTCNACGVRSQKLINRLAYERGTVFIQIMMAKRIVIAKPAFVHILDVLPCSKIVAPFCSRVRENWKSDGNITKFKLGDGAGVTSTESWTVGGAGGLGTVGAGAGA
ncbi:putative tRNA(adenine(34)) deaminase, chloroplastic-like [Capsicum annuum]|nr:putative tRNA(adenine(34)) deaminase, chloroplastic-like [Capsicum annuum]